MAAPTYSTVFVELDALFDTRLATLVTFGKPCVKANLTDAYFTRLSDTFVSVDPVQYAQRYLSRDRYILQNALTTPIRNILINFVSSTLIQSRVSPFQSTPKIIINAFPYQLTEAESRIILAGIRIITAQKADLQLVYMPPSELTPAYIKETVSLFILYDYPYWLEYHSATGDFKKTTCPEVSLLGPILYFKSPPKHASSVDPFATIEEMAAPLISLKLLPIQLFSINVIPKQ